MNSIEKDLKNVKGYRFPFEGDRHMATLIQLPYRKDTWRNDAVPALEEYLNVVRAISKYELVCVIVDPRISYKTVASFEGDNVYFFRDSYNDAWSRDMTPVFLLNDETKLMCGVDFGFNAWGGKVDGLYADYSLDNELSKNILMDLLIPRYPFKDFILEGGSIHSDGEGTLLVTECCLLSKGRNPKLSKEDIEKNLKKSLNVKKVLWVPNGIYEDETSGHIDNIACFIKPGVVALAWTDDENDPQYKLSKENFEYLSKVKDAKGRKLEIVKVKLPKPQYMTKEEADGLILEDGSTQRLEGRRLAASYINFYMGEKFIVLPQFGDDNDIVALNQFKELFPNKEIIPVYSREILLGGGNIHCITKQIPYSEKYYIVPKEGDK